MGVTKQTKRDEGDSLLRGVIDTGVI